MEIKIFPAKSGDSFLINYGSNLENHILIDGGFIETYDNFIKKELLKINSRNEKLNLLIITHVDRDHISGILKLLKENGNSKEYKIIKIDEIWHNSYRHLQFDYSENIESGEKEKQNQILKSFYLQINNENSSKKGKISIEQGSMLSSYILENNYNWNNKFDNNAVLMDYLKKISIDENLNIIVLSPSKDTLEKLKFKWKNELIKKKSSFKFEENKLFDDAYEYYLIRESNKKYTRSKKCSLKKKIDINEIKEYEVDKRIENESSIAIIIEYKEKKMLFLGDSNPEVIEKSLKSMKLMGYETNFDLVKLSHHGSLSSNTHSLINLIDSKNWIFSGNGENDNPDIDLIKMILKLKKEYFKNFIFNYKLNFLDSLTSDISMKEYNYNIISSVENKDICIKI
ncbi:MBL fold metallo-hydrolase [Sebaldella termitidis]|uniref:MBL fold metallo-hydrolase n=1 Tax=Sebaldella termitidis TaxID=826 RepID=UPI003EB74E1B